MNKYCLLPISIFVVSMCFASEEILDKRVNDILNLDNDVAYGEYLASECSTCHNTTSGDSGIPKIHGKEQAQLIQALLDYQDGTRSNETMRSVVGVLSDEEIGALALYFSGQ